MKRFIIHVTKTFYADITIEAESEQIARNYVINLTDGQFNWHGADQPTITMIDRLGDYPESNDG